MRWLLGIGFWKYIQVIIVKIDRLIAIIASNALVILSVVILVGLINYYNSEFSNISKSLISIFLLNLISRLRNKSLA